MAKDSFMGRLLGNADKFTDKQVAQTLTLLIDHGVSRGASDIHIEPHERFVLVRYRIDGTLRGVHKLPRSALGVVMAQLKTLASLNKQETSMPQEGDCEFEVGDQHVKAHLTVMPVYGGEKAVLHLTAAPGKLSDLASLGFWGDGLAALTATITTPHGLVVVSGPRHSGISSTLFSLLQSLNTPLASLATVESKPGHRLPGVTQTYATGGMTIQAGLQATLKQDPNVIMIDNVPDSTTAELTVHAATTGHLILAGMHTENSMSAVLRLRHAGVEPFLLASSLRASVSQRLVRKLCPDCRQRYNLNEEERTQIEDAFGITSAAARKRVHDLERTAAPTIFGDVKQLSSTPTHIAYLWRPNESGCDNCDHSGYQGQTAIVEVLKNTDTLHKALLAREVTTLAALQASVVKDGFIPMGLDGLVKALRGQTTVAEVLRAVSN